MAKSTTATTTKRDRDLFERLRRAGVRKQVARPLSELGEGAGRKAVAAGRAAVAELRSLADELERRLPSEAPERAPTGTRAGRRTARPAASAPRRKRSSPVAPRQGAVRASAPTQEASRAPAPRQSADRTPRGQNKADILAALKGGPQTASQIAGTTGIGVGTVSSTLTKMARSGEVAKAPRGYRLPG